MKKYAKILVAILLISLLATALFACINPDNDTSGKMTLVILNGDDATEFTVDLAKIPPEDSSKGLIAILDYLQNDGQLTYTAEGTMLTQVGDLQGSKSNRTYIAIYTSVSKDISVGAWATVVTYKGITCTSSDYGASEMTILADCVIVLTTATW